MTQRLARASRRGDDGFTLVELLVVIAILGILSAVVVFATRGAGDKGKSAAVSTDERILRTAEELYCAQFGHYGTEQELVAARLLAAPPEIHTVSASDTGAEGNCPNGEGKPEHYDISCRIPDCDLPLPTTSTTLVPPGGLFRDAGTMGFPGGGVVALPGGGALHVGVLQQTPRKGVADLFTAPGTWTALPDPPVATSHNLNPAHIVDLKDGRRVLVGFRWPAQWFLYTYNPVSPAPWAPTGGSPITQRNIGSSAVLIPQGDRCGAHCGKVLWFGGRTDLTPAPVAVDDTMLASAELYDPASGLFIPTTSMGTKRLSALTVGLPNGTVLVAGGGGEGTFNYQIFDPRTETWTARRALPAGLNLDPGSLTPFSAGSASRILAIDQFGKSSVYDWATDSWTAPIDCGCSANAAVLESGKVLAVGNRSSRIFDPVEGEWADGPQPAENRARGSSARLTDGRALVIGGTSSPAAGTAELYSSS